MHYLKRATIGLMIGSVFVGCTTTRIPIEDQTNNKTEKVTYSKEHETTQTEYPPVGSKAAELLTKSEVVRDRKGHIIRTVNYLTDSAAKENGFTIQIDEYNKFGQHTRFIMLFTPEREYQTGFTKQVDHVDEQDNLVAVDLYDNDTYIFSLDTDEIKALEDYPLLRMRYYYDQYHEENIKETTYNLEAPYMGGTTYVEYMNKMESISEKEKYLITGWLKMHNKSEYNAIHNKKVLVKEKGIEFWVCFQDELLQYLKNDLHMVLRYLYIGETIEGPTYLVSYMKELN